MLVLCNYFFVTANLTSRILDKYDAIMWNALADPPFSKDAYEHLSMATFANFRIENVVYDKARW